MRRILSVSDQFLFLSISKSSLERDKKLSYRFTSKHCCMMRAKGVHRMIFRKNLKNYINLLLVRNFKCKCLTMIFFSHLSFNIHIAMLIVLKQVEKNYEAKS